MVFGTLGLKRAMQEGDLMSVSALSVTQKAQAVTQKAQAVTQQLQKAVLTDQAETLSIQTPIINKMNTSVSASGDRSSVEQATALTDKYTYCINKLNFTLKLISQNAGSITSRSHYATVVRPVFESHYTDTSVASDGYVVIADAIATNTEQSKIYFFEPNSAWDNVQQNTWSAYRQNFEPVGYDIFNNLLSKNPAQNKIYVILPYDWETGVKIAFFLFIKDVTDTTKWIKIVSGFNLTQVMPAYQTVNQVPASYLLYLHHLQDALNGGSAIQTKDKNAAEPPYNSYLQYAQQVKGQFKQIQTNILTADSDDTVYQHGPDKDFNNLKIVSSETYPSWTNKSIAESYIPGSNKNMPKIISQINTQLNKNYTKMQDGDTVKVQYAIEDKHYTAIVKMQEDPGYGLCYTVKHLNINDVISDAASIKGDVGVHGNLNVSRYDNDPIITTDNARRTTTFHDKVGINQHAHEVDALLDIDNLTKQEVLELFTRSAQGAVNSSDIINIIRANPTGTSATAISALFGSGYSLFDYKDQCSVFTSKLDFIIDPSNITQVHDFDITKWSTGTFTRIHQLVKDVKQMSSEYTAANDSSFMFTFVELFSDANLSWFFTTIKAIIRQDASGNDILIFVLTKIDVTNIMKDTSYTGILTSIVDYMSRINRNLNYNVLLVKNAAFYTDSNPANAFKIPDFNQAKQSNSYSYFSRGFDLLPESYMFFYETATNKFKYHGNFNGWSGKSGDECWSNSLNAGDVLKDITQQLSIKYNGVSNGNFCVKYIWAGLQKLTFVHKTTIGGKDYIIGSGVGIKSILNRSLKVRGEGNFTGDFIVNDAYDNVIFKVDNVNKTISNAYNVGVGTTNPHAMLDVKDTSIQDVIDEAAIRIAQLKLMNPILDTMRSSGFNDVTHNTNLYKLVQEQTYKQYTVVYKINTDTLRGEDVKVLYHQLYPEWTELNQRTLAEILGDDIANRSLIQSMIAFLQATLDSDMIFDGNYFIRIFNHTVYGDTNVGHAIVKSGNNTYIYTHNTSLLNFNVRHTLSRSVTKLFETRECISKATANLWRSVTGIPTSSVINLQEGQNVLNSLIQRNSDIRKSIYKVKFDVIDPVNPANIYITDMSFNGASGEEYALSAKTNYIIQKFIHLVNATMKAYGDKNQTNGGFKSGYLLSVVYEDNRNDYLAVSRCYSAADNIVTLIVPEFCLQDVLIPSLNVAGDAKVVGDLMISDASTNFVSIDPVQKFVGINTDDRIINYPDRKYTTTTNADGKYDAKHHVHVKGKTYPVMVSERIQEVDRSTNEGPTGPQYFGTYSGFTVKRTSELYNFDDIVKYATTQNGLEALDTVTRVKYGPDVSFEVCDKTNRTVELGNVQMTIDTVDASGYLKGGFGVQVIDPPVPPSDLSKKRNIMYVDNSGTLFINKIKLGGKYLSVEGGVLKWDGKTVHLDT